MRLLALPIGIFAVTCGLLATATPARALADETWVSGTGSDTGTTCPISAPCRTFAYAILQTNNNGTINVLSSGEFGPVFINKSVSIVAEGVEATIQSGFQCPGVGPTAVCIKSGATGVVNLRGLIIDLRGTLFSGIYMTEGAALRVQNSLIRHGTQSIFYQPNGNSELYVSDSTIADNSDTGIMIAPSGAANAKITFDRVHVENNTFGILFHGDFGSGTGALVATVRDSVVAGGSSQGILARKLTNPGSVRVMVDRTALVNNQTGIRVDGPGATVFVGDSTISGNDTGLLTTSGGIINSYKTNKVNGNTIDGTPTATVLYK